MQIRKNKRESNIELLRFIAMMMVLAVHANFFAIGTPSTINCSEHFDNAAARIIFESMSIVCVDVFILISGWFGIKSSMRGFSNFVFQCLFFLIGIYVVVVIIGIRDLSIKGLAECLVLTKSNWFIKAYIGLYLLSPVLNSFVEKADKLTFRNVLVAFFIFQTIYGWISNAAVFFEMGYSTISFIGLYLLARYVRIHESQMTNMPSFFYILIYLFFSFILSFISFGGIYFDFIVISARMYSYINPIVILSVLSLLLFFNSLCVKSRVINWFAASSFAVFLLHSNPNILQNYFVRYVKIIYNQFDGFLCLTILLVFISFIAIIAVLIDQIRIVIWRRVFLKYIFKSQK
ncbi:putative transmembrane protein [Bacteroides coprosuis DSM 18011]|uniref:Putative transmembrane protein n=1 Tax=Bacteroides coprosuis DSM 18011 TaxID=679937 RepID=F3ZS30_9BACE|nr:acyltransferase family protein [Bacteroides coprosuis]EGJ72051.1 putative transmembrane protein [Bacteroides coprosuis DSM 18011]